MCAQFLLKTPLARILQKFGAVLAGNITGAELPERVLPYRRGAVIVLDHEIKLLTLMQFSLIPSWSKEKRLKFSTHNARLDTIDAKPTWKTPFLKRHCLVPISHFIEPIYEGEYAGNMVRFSRQDEEPLAAVAIYEHREAAGDVPELHSFAIVTDEPCEFVRRIGHDRQPIFLDSEKQDKWLQSSNSTAKELKEFLRESRFDPAFTVAVDRRIKGKQNTLN